MRSRGAKLALGVALVGAVLLSAPGGASAVTCDEGAGTVFFDDLPGEASRISVGWRSNSGGGETMLYRDEPGGGAGSCGTSTQWLQLTVALRDRSDRLRLDARRPSLDGFPGPDYGPVHPDIAVFITGGSGGDKIRGRRGFEDVRSGRGDDTVDVEGGGADQVSCGRGEDTAKVSPNDLVDPNCEAVS